MFMRVDDDYFSDESDGEESKSSSESDEFDEDFGDEFDYADNVIEGAVNDFLTIQEETFLDDRYDEIHDILIEKCKDWFGEYLFEIYRMTCEEN